MKTNEEIRNEIKTAYGEIVSSKGTCCGPSCCDTATSFKIGYTEEQLANLPKDADLGLGCGNPTAMAGLSAGEVVLDLGSGAGIDAFLAAKAVGKTGRVIGVDMTPEMLKSARDSATESGLSDRVEFREGKIEQLPVVSESIDLILSNCVINLSPDKPQAFAEAFRVLKPGGRISISDICLSEPLPKVILDSVAAYLGCVAGAAIFDDYLGMIKKAGFTDIEWTSTNAKPIFEGFASDPVFATIAKSIEPQTLERAAASVFSYQINARRL